jgi:hypothetical protein
MLSGLAAVGGVMIVGMLSGIVDINAFTPAPGLTADAVAAGESIQGQGAQVKAAVLGLADIFSLEKYPFALVLASIFGLTPKSFLQRLQRASEQSKLNLQSTGATRQE